HKEFVINFMSVTYMDGEDVKRVSMRKWLALGEPSYLEFSPKYHYYGTPSVNLTTGEFNQLIDP
ncbi:hypothetical protein LCGC14_3144490, partial [marine sediment metagenome]